MTLVTADAEQAKSTGGMLALVPHVDDARWYSVDGGEPVEDMHCTLYYFGEDVTGRDPYDLVVALDEFFDASRGFPAISARTFGHALFNPDGANDREPCAVYLIGDNAHLVPLRDELVNIITNWGGGAEMPKQHEPYHPHMTAGYSIGLDKLTPPGPVIFDQVVLTWAGESYYFALVD